MEGDYAATLTVSDGEADASDDVAITAVPCQPTLIDTDINEDTTFPDVCLATDLPDYIVSGTPDVNAEVTIEPGVQMVFEEQARFRVNDGGSILAQGTVEAPIRMLGQEATPGYWRGLYFNGQDVTSELDHVFGEHGGHVWDGVGETATIVVGNDASVSLTNSVLRESSGSGLYLEPRARLTSFATNTFEENGAFSAVIPDVQLGAMDSDTSYGVDVLVYATVGIDPEMTVMPLSSSLDGPEYRMRGFFEVNAPVTLDPGVVLAFEEDGAIRVNDGGALLARGTAQDSIVMTGVEEVAGSWRGILFRADDKPSELDNVWIGYGGGEVWAGAAQAANLTLEDTSVSLTNSTIAYSAGWGVWLDSSLSELTGGGNTYEGNANGSVGM